MIRVHVICEGYTEAAFVNKLLKRHFESRNISLTSINQKGVSNYKEIKREVEKLCKSDPSSKITTFLDYYGLKNSPKLESTSLDFSSFEQAKALEKLFEKEIDQPNFIAHLSIHEFEGLLFSDPSVFSNWFDKNAVKKLQSIVNKFPSPEHINNSKETAPSKRILQICSNYEKVLHGTEISERITLDGIRGKCSHFDAWIKKLEQLV